MLHALFVLTLAHAASPPPVGCTGLLAAPHAALDRPVTEFDGRTVFEIDYTTKFPGRRTIALPAIVREIASGPDLRVIVLAGNSGWEYEGTRHNLGFVFGDYLLHHFAARLSRSGEPVASTETVNVTYDDATSRSWRTTFRTEAPFARTVSGEVFYIPDFGGARVLVIKAIGDYNEVGDFGVAILDALRVPAGHLLLIHDDLKQPEGTVDLVTGPQKYAGNKAQLSVIRNLAYATFDLAEEYLASWGFTSDDALEFVLSFYDLADVRQPGHLGRPDAYAAAFKSSDAIMAGLAKLIAAAEDKGKAPLVAQVERLRGELAQAKRPLAGIAAELNTPGVSQARRAELMAARARIIADSGPLSQAVAIARAEVEGVRNEMQTSIRALAERRLTFSRLTIGTDNGAVDENDLAGFVRAPYPRAAFDDQVWARAADLVKRWVTTENR